MEVSINGARILGYVNVPLFGQVPITQTLSAALLVMVIITCVLAWAPT